MTHSPLSYPRMLPCGDSAMSIELGDTIDLAVNRRVQRLYRSLTSPCPPGIRDIFPGYRSLMIQYDPREWTLDRLTDLVTSALAEGEETDIEEPVVEVPVCYGGEFGPDLPEVAAHTGFSEADVVARHAAGAYDVYMIGFSPGFCFLGGLDPRLATPRKKTPRERIPPGSVGIANTQTGIYSIETPGGWQLIGRTPLPLFDMTRPDPFTFRAGMRLRFVPITEAEFERY